MAITLVTDAEATATTGDCSITFTAFADDIVVASCGQMDTANPPIALAFNTAGYTTIHQDEIDTSRDCSAHMGYKKMPGTPDTSVSWDNSTASARRSGACMSAWDGCDLTTPADDTSGLTETAASTAIDAPSVTTTVANTVIVTALMMSSFAGGAEATGGPSGYTLNDANISVETSIGSAQNGMAYKAEATSGTYDPGDWDESTNGWDPDNGAGQIMGTIALQEPIVAGGATVGQLVNSGLVNAGLVNRGLVA